MKAKKILAVLLAAVMLFSAVPFAASAAETEPSSIKIDGYVYYQIATADDLVWLSDQVKKNIKPAANAILVNDIDLSEVEDWYPIGATVYKYQGTFDGANFTVSGLDNGLFGCISRAAIKNVTVSGDIKNSVIGNRLGMVVCESLDSLLYNCKAVGKVNYKSEDDMARCYVGGVVGAALHSVVINCAAQTDIDVTLSNTVEYANVGGVAGAATVGTVAPYCILNSYCTGDITVSGNELKMSSSGAGTNQSPRFCVGGIAGYLEDDAVNNYYSGTITDKEAANTVKNIGYAFGYVDPEYLISTTTNEDGTITYETGMMVIKHNYYSAGKTAIGAIADGDYDSTGWTTAVAANANLVDILNANTDEVAQIITDHRDILKDSAWSDIVKAANGDAVTVSKWEKGEDNLPVTTDTEIEGTVKVCNHMCHKGGFMGFIWTIVRFFQKAFGTNPVCECGVAHY